MSQKRVLIVEDDGAVRDLIAAILGNAGFLTETAPDGFSMQLALEKAPFDLLLLDLNLPDSDGLELARTLRSRSQMGIIIVSERGEPEERAKGLEIGADDYIAKPFFPRELLARVRNVLDRTQGNDDLLVQSDNVVMFAGWTLDKTNRLLISADGTSPTLTPAEFDLLAFLASHPNQLLSRDALAEAVPEMGTDSGERAVDILVSRLRKKIGDEKGENQLIETIRGHGYRFNSHVKHSVG
ncbi:response regulator transcription factor [Terasakiella sp. A23]|uniref:response regulator transcription factor n=1 Tax=Terasakiella sp. FCG-A23 TaxID=3080561 RepID=UPI002954FF66|nr:response regulator transcription factor [Terasakiella sp. A23]MDV7339574.1 response regulator transcription factor [Terasakiella sp. A23]